MEVTVPRNQRHVPSTVRRYGWYTPRSAFPGQATPGVGRVPEGVGVGGFGRADRWWDGVGDVTGTGGEAGTGEAEKAIPLGGSSGAAGAAPAQAVIDRSPTSPVAAAPSHGMRRLRGEGRALMVPVGAAGIEPATSRV